MTGPDLSIVLPVHNEAESLPELLREIREVLGASRWSFEVIAVDDGSTDTSLMILREERRQMPAVRILRLERHSGQTAALDAGWRAARGRYLVSLDADLQNDPSDIAPMIERLERGEADMVIGVRLRRQDTVWRRIQARIGNRVRDWITGDSITDTGCSLKAVRRECVEPIRLFDGMHRFLPSLVRMDGYEVIEMPVNHRPRLHGQTKYGVANRALRGLTDCFAVRWMMRRNLRYRILGEEQ